MSLKKEQYVWAFLRISLGWTFLWAFLDKVFGLGFTTTAEGAWLAGGSPATGFLQFGTAGPFAGMYQAMAGNAFVDWLFMFGLLLIGLALILGIGVKVAGYSGALLMFLMWIAVLPPEHNPFMDDHLIYGIALIGLTFVKSGHWIGLGEWWSNQTIVKNNQWLQ